VLFVMAITAQCNESCYFRMYRWNGWEIVMTIDIFLASRNPLGRRRFTEAEPSHTHAVQCRELATRWYEDSKARYEVLTRQWLELAAQRQRCA
jgi:hypothetical protein